ncbi:type I pantothenate kinase [Alkalihalobacillus hemicellulosilyticus]|uniref:Pantothenate kinase n=1 Tax=Halalkalibacter hemicellulosilyticusJCM 9152 TaxID=1236971 RepID=W4QHV7_9BACI|nr:type I pantothenate kinase [Halalkalibacter hemicellulosilyticus]GAE31238.1 pantothenate kinase [Halalkalibacter hemicellulosilyticusJCM 9152]
MSTLHQKAPLSTYTTFKRQEWANLSEATKEILSDDERTKIGSIDQTISADEVADVYLPLSQLLYLNMEQALSLHSKTNRFLQKQTKKTPYIIGIAGSVSVGKSTTARLLQALIKRWPSKPSVELITTDGFLYPNAILQEKNLMKRKGFPESYDIERLIHFLYDLKSGTSCIKAPLYSHLTYDVLPDTHQTIESPDVVIIEGINVLQVNKKNQHIPHVFVSDFFDFSIYVDADERDIQAWYIERFKLLRNTAFQKSESYFHQYRDLSDQEAEEISRGIWQSINAINLEENIRPTRHRADMILKKGAGHKVKEVRLKNL